MWSIARGTEIGRPTDPRERFKELIAEAKGLIAKKQWYRAVKTVNKAKALAEDTSQKQEVAKLCEQLDAEGRRRIEECRKAYVGKRYSEALNGYGVILRTFTRLPSAIAARKALKAAESDPEAQSVLQVVKARNLDRLIAQAIDGYKGWDGKVASASDESGGNGSADTEPKLLRVEKIKRLDLEKRAKVFKLLTTIAKSYPASEQGKRAIADLKVLQENKDFQASLEKHKRGKEAERLFRLAETYRKAKMTARAVKQYNLVAEKFPGTPLAMKSKQLARGLQK